MQDQVVQHLILLRFATSQRAILKSHNVIVKPRNCRSLTLPENPTRKRKVRAHRLLTRTLLYHFWYFLLFMLLIGVSRLQLRIIFKLPPAARHYPLMGTRRERGTSSSAAACMVRSASISNALFSLAA